MIVAAPAKAVTKTSRKSKKRANGSDKSRDQESAVGGRKAFPLEGERHEEQFRWKVELAAAVNYGGLGQRLAEARGDLYRNGTDGHWLMLVMANGKSRLITKGANLVPLIVDSVPMCVTKGGKLVNNLPPMIHLNAMLHSDAFLGQFQPLDEVVTDFFYLDDFSLAKPGRTDGGPGQRVLNLGLKPQIAESTVTIEQFLDMMDFATNADRTNCVAAALTVMLRRRWSGQKPAVVVTGTKSHCGKGTITDFIRGAVPKADILYEQLDWPMMSQFQRQLHMNPQIGVVIFDNVRGDSSGSRAKFIRSGFVESVITNPEIHLASPGAGEPVHVDNRFVVTLNTNEGRLSPDLLNRAVSIHLAPKGSVLDRECPLGDPKLEFLPKHRPLIEAELHGMIARWKTAGCPLDDDVKHSMTHWARTIGGILKFNGFTDFLANAATRKSADDPIREALAILGAAEPDKPQPPREWARLAVTQGLAKTLLPPNERETDHGRERSIGVVLKRHLDETFTAQTEAKVLRLRLEGGFKRWEKGKNGHVRYVFTVLGETEIPTDEEVPRHVVESPGTGSTGEGVVLTNGENAQGGGRGK